MSCINRVDKLYSKPRELNRIKDLIAQGKENIWYNSASWEHVKAVLKLDCHECQLCKAKGRYSKAVIVHHVKHLKDRPDLALSIYDPETGERQLLSVCKKCHEEVHPESQRQCTSLKEPITIERWD